MEKKTKPTLPNAAVQNKTLSKPRIFFGVLFVLLSVVLTFSFISYLLNWKSDQSQAGTMLDKTVQSSNIFGKIGDWLGNIFIFESIGIAAFAVAFLFFVVGMMIFKKNYFKPWKTIGHSLFFICWLPIFMGAVTKGHGVLSGVYGFHIMDFLLSVIGSAGLWLVLIVSIGLYFILEFNLNPANVKAKLNDLNENTVGRVKAMMPNSSENFVADEELEEMQSDNHEILPNIKNLAVPLPVEIPVKGFPEVEINNDFETVKTPNETSFDEADLSHVTVTENFGNSANLNPGSESTTPPTTKTDNIDFKFEVAKTVDILDESDQKSQELVDKHGLYDHKLELSKFQMPTLDLLRDYGNEEISINRDELEENKNKIVGLLKNFNVGIAEIKATVGPTVTLYEIVPEAGIRVASIKKLQDDIALNLSALGIRIIAPMPGKGTIGIEVPRKNPSMVSMRSVIASQKFQNTDMDLPVVFGKTISNEIFMADLAKMPHLLMAGATGQGKSVGINAILTSLLYKKHPSELKFVMVDPKKVELSLYSKIERHYLAKLPDGDDAIITDTHKVINTLNSLCVEMDQRYDLLKNAFCKNSKGKFFQYVFHSFFLFFGLKF